MSKILAVTTTFFFILYLPLFSVTSVPDSVIRRIHLEESESYPLSNISNCVASPDGQRLVICSYVDNILYLVRKDGRVEKIFGNDPALCDSLVISIKDKAFLPKGYKLFKNGEVKDEDGAPMPADFQRKFLDIRFQNASFKDNKTVYLSGGAGALALDTVSKKRPLYYHHPTIFTFDVLSGSLQLIPLDFSSGKPPYPGDGETLLYDAFRKELYVNVTQLNEAAKPVMDSLWGISSYTPTGYLKQPLMKMPKEYKESGLAYKLFRCFLAQDTTGAVWAIFGDVPKIFNAYEGNYMQLQHLRYSNSQYFEEAKKQSPKFKLDSLIHLKPLTFRRVDITKSNTLLVTYSHFDFQQNKPTWFVQEYTTQGDFIREREQIEDTELGKIEYISYSKAENAIIICSLSEMKGWTITFKRWE